MARIPKPASVSNLANNPRRKKEVDLQGTQSVPAPPKHLNKIANDKFIEVCDLLSQMKVITQQDADAVEKYAINYATFRECYEQIKAGNLIQTNPKTGYENPSPYSRIMNQVSQQMDKFLLEYGFTAASRARMRVKAEEENDDKHEDDYGI